MELLKAIILGAIQGVTEFLPVSSTGHLILAEHFLGISQETYGLAFDAALHLGTLAAVLWFFAGEWMPLLQGLVRVFRTQKIHTEKEKTAVLLLAATIPAAVIGFVGEKYVETAFRSPALVAWSLIGFSAVLWYVEQLKNRTKEISQLAFVDSILIGFAQAIALIPGVSRSGITIATGMWRGLTREQSARFAFLLSAPIVAGAGGKKVVDVLQNTQILASGDLIFYAVGIICSAIFGYLTIKYFLKYVSKHSLNVFIIYRIILGLVVLLIK